MYGEGAFFCLKLGYWGLCLVEDATLFRHLHATLSSSFKGSKTGHGGASRFHKVLCGMVQRS